MVLVHGCGWAHQEVADAMGGECSLEHLDGVFRVFTIAV